MSAHTTPIRPFVRDPMVALVAKLAASIGRDVLLFVFSIFPMSIPSSTRLARVRAVTLELTLETLSKKNDSLTNQVGFEFKFLIV